MAGVLRQSLDLASLCVHMVSTRIHPNVATAEAHVNQAMEVWRDRSARHWTLDLSMLTGAGVTPRTPPSAGDRAAHAERSAPRED